MLSFNAYFLNDHGLYSSRVQHYFIDSEASSQTILLSDDEDDIMIVTEVPARPNPILANEETLFEPDQIDNGIVLRNISPFDYGEYFPSDEGSSVSSWTPSEEESIFTESESDEETIFNSDSDDQETNSMTTISNDSESSQDI